MDDRDTEVRPDAGDGGEQVVTGTESGASDESTGIADEAGTTNEPLPVADLSGEVPIITETDDEPGGGPEGSLAGEDVVRPAELEEFDAVAGDSDAAQIEVLSDVVLPITVELGRVSKRIRELLSTGPGSVIQLDRQTSDPVDVLAGGRLIARGEVVVVGSSMGVRITELVHPGERTS
jgi:flagellar motor switch protein FliN